LREISGGVGEAGDVAQLQTNQNVLADLTEALIGAVYLTFGFETTRPAVVEVFDEHIRYAESGYIDHKTELQEYLAWVSTWER
jgi:ribonuclease-3